MTQLTDQIKNILKEVENLEKLVYEDALTGLHNRRWMDDNMPKKCGYFIIFDLDDFKRVNDTYGYEEGDKVLQSFAHFLKSRCRTTKSANRNRSVDHVFVARRGGDEFLVWTESTKALNAIRGRIKGWVHLRTGTTVSVGWGVTEQEAWKHLRLLKGFKES